MSEEYYRQRIAELEAENARLKEGLELIKAERKALRDELYGAMQLDLETTDEEYSERIKNHVPGSGLKFLQEIESGLEKAT